MRKLGIPTLFMFAVILLAACTGGDSQEEVEKDEVLSVHEDFHELVDGAKNNVNESQDLIDELINGDINYDDFKNEKELKIEYMDELRSSLDDVEEPEEEKADEYYKVSYDLVDTVVDAVESNLDVPEDINHEEKVEKYNEKTAERQEELEKVQEDYDEYKEKLENEDSDYREAFKE